MMISFLKIDDGMLLCLQRHLIHNDGALQNSFVIISSPLGLFQKNTKTIQWSSLPGNKTSQHTDDLLLKFKQSSLSKTTNFRRFQTERVCRQLLQN